MLFAFLREELDYSAEYLEPMLKLKVLELDEKLGRELLQETTRAEWISKVAMHFMADIDGLTSVMNTLSLPELVSLLSVMTELESADAEQLNTFWSVFMGSLSQNLSQKWYLNG